MKSSSEERRKRATTIISILREATRGMVPAASFSIIEKMGKDPYLILVGCLLSLRTKDSVSLPASLRLFTYAKTPQEMLALPRETIERAIYPVGFYRTKAKNIQLVSHVLLERFHGRVPSNEEDLLSLPGVGRKTMNLVLAEAFDIPAICVDTHVHRISNRLGIVDTKTPEETELALRALIPKKYWKEINHLFVMWGQNICLPQSPFCSKCPLFDLCERRGVTKYR